MLRSRRRRVLDDVGVGLLGSASLGVLAVAVLTCRRGLDFWDESYGLLLVEWPDASRAGGEIFLAQFVLRPLFVGVGRDVVLYRVAGLCVLAVVAWVATRSVLALLRHEGHPMPRPWGAAPVVVAACSTTAFVGAGRIPGYRVVVLVALLLVVAAVCRLLVREDPRWGLALGAAGVLAFTGKPTSAVALAVVVAVVVLPVAGSVRQVLGTVGWGVVGVVAAATVVLLLARMTPADAVGYLTRGAQVDAASGAHGSWPTMLGAGPVPLRVLALLGPVLVAPVLVAVLDVVRHRRTRWPAGAQILSAVPAAVGVGWLGVTLLAHQGYGDQVRQLVLLWGLVPLLVLVLLRGRLGAHRRARSVVLLLLVGPWVATVGTNTGFAATMTQAGVLWALAVVACVPLATVVTARVERLALPAAMLLVTTAAVAQLVWAADALESRDQREGAVPTRVLGGRVGVEPETARLLGALREVSAREGFAGRPAIDLTGYGPGYQLALGTRPLGRASFFGAFDGAERGAALALSRETCADRASALVLRSADNPLDVSAAVGSWGLDLDSDYVEVARFHPTHGEADLRAQTVRVLRPMPRVAAVLGCPDAAAGPGPSAALSPSAGRGPGPGLPAAAAGPRR